ncbi:MAG: hypothetical protein OEV87_10270 [Phycisphaerae bacterium]|nr:hypothetical protein [Phycisphaerae bacterium]
MRKMAANSQNQTIRPVQEKKSTSAPSALATISLFLITSLYVFLLLEMCVVGSMKIRESFHGAGVCISFGAIVLGISALLQRCFVRRRKWWLAIISIPLASVFFWIMCLIDVIKFD